MKQYIFRLDDITPGMNWDNFNKIEIIFDKYGIKPIIGVVPNNKDIKLDGYGKIDDFWGKIKELENKGWIIAQHGYTHEYSTKKSGIIGLNKYSEFAGLSYENQLNKIQSGKQILEKNIGTKIIWWMAPAHSFDKNTCKVLKDTGFQYITDGLSLFPFKKFGLKWLPQQIWKGWNYPYGIGIGTFTICFHINGYNHLFFNDLENFIKKNKSKIIIDSLENINFNTNIIKNILNILFKYYFKILMIIFKSLNNIKGKH